MAGFVGHHQFEHNGFPRIALQSWPFHPLVCLTLLARAQSAGKDATACLDQPPLSPSVPAVSADKERLFFSCLNKCLIDPLKLSLKIPLAFLIALVLMFSGALYGIFALNRSIDIYRVAVAANVANERMVSETLVTFKLQVQEWKDTLLRGKDPVKLDKYWTSFQTGESTVDQLAGQLAQKLPAGESRDLIARFASAHHAMGGGYRRGFEAFKAAGFEASAGDNAVAGVDREPAALLEQAAKKIAFDSAEVSALADRAAHRASVVSIALMLIVLALASCAATYRSRKACRSAGDGRVPHWLV